MNRRESLKGASLFVAGATLAACGGSHAAEPRGNWLLVHGAWHSSLHWNRVAALLAARGHLVHAVDLPGAGLDAKFPASWLRGDFGAFVSEPSPLRGLHLADYKAAVIAQVERMAANGKVTLVGHSMGGVTVTAVAEALARPAWAQTQEQLQRALDEARSAAARAQAAAAAAEAALQRMQSASPASATGAAAPVVAATVPQSGFTISGNIDVGPRVTSHSDPARDKSELAFNNASTSLIFFKGSRRLGPDLAASFSLEIDYNPTQSSTANAAPAAGAYTGTPFTGEQYVALAGRFGELRLGTPNAGALVAGVTAQPFATALGSGYSGTFGRLGTTAVSGINQFSGALAGRVIRHEKTLMAITPTVAGLKGSVEYAFGNDNAAAPTGNTNRYAGLTAYYNRGPWNAVYAYANERAGAAGASGPAPAIGTAGPVVLPANTDITWHLLGANYTWGATTLHGGWTSSRHDAATPLERSHSWNVALRHLVHPRVALLANYVARHSELATAPDGRLLGLGLNWMLDGNTIVYGRAELVRLDAAGAVAAQRQGTYAVGVQYRF